MVDSLSNFNNSCFRSIPESLCEGRMTELDKVANIDCSYELMECRDSLEDISDFLVSIWKMKWNH
ncbi:MULTISPECIES: hypothetical protein [Clostridium]|uniref:hypothetical protein n=1 Tax=Clostridium TaxID=1485 RepID=UPI0013F74A89|nr:MULTISPECIES: hypothetical protein [Clostridium]NFL44730.1 hypothetical protein [Clostridium botulinum]NFL89145.1 hypothetical protein [Clostridium botulinum]